MKQRKITIAALDLKAIKAVKACGFVGIDLSGDPYLESSVNIGRGRLKRLIAHKLLKNNQDALLKGLGMTQSYSLTRRGREVADA
jgi:hypothetical protein